MINVELNHLYQVNTTHLLMEECGHTVEEGSHTVEEGNGSGNVQWKRAMEMKHQSS